MVLIILITSKNMVKTMIYLTPKTKQNILSAQLWNTLEIQSKIFLQKIDNF